MITSSQYISHVENYNEEGPGATSCLRSRFMTGVMEMVVSRGEEREQQSHQQQSIVGTNAIRSGNPCNHVAWGMHNTIEFIVDFTVTATDFCSSDAGTDAGSDTSDIRCTFPVAENGVSHSSSSSSSPSPTTCTTTVLPQSLPLLDVMVVFTLPTGIYMDTFELENILQGTARDCSDDGTICSNTSNNSSSSMWGKTYIHSNSDKVDYESLSDAVGDRVENSAQMRARSRHHIDSSSDSSSTSKTYHKIGLEFTGVTATATATATSTPPSHHDDEGNTTTASFPSSSSSSSSSLYRMRFALPFHLRYQALDTADLILQQQQPDQKSESRMRLITLDQPHIYGRPHLFDRKGGVNDNNNMDNSNADMQVNRRHQQHHRVFDWSFSGNKGNSDQFLEQLKLADQCKYHPPGFLSTIDNEVGAACCFGPYRRINMSVPVPVDVLLPGGSAATAGGCPGSGITFNIPLGAAPHLLLVSVGTMLTVICSTLTLLYTFLFAKKKKW